MKCYVCAQPVEYIGVVDPGGIDHGWSHVEYDDGLEHKAWPVPDDYRSPFKSEEEE